MATFVLIHGGGGSGWDWHLVEAELRRRGHDVVAPDLPIEDPVAKLADFADAVVSAVAKQSNAGDQSKAGDQPDVVVAGHSYGGFTAPLVADRLNARLLVFVAGMVPAPGETPGQWWGNTGFTSPGEELSVVEKFFGDVPSELTAENIAHGRDQLSAEWNDPWPLAALPAIPTHVLLCRDDRFFTPELQRRVAKDRLGATPDEIDGSHMVLLSRPVELAERLEGYFATLR